MYRNRGEPSKILRYRLGASSNYSSRDAEYVGCIMALWLLKGENPLSQAPISLCMDSQAFIQSIGARRASSGSYLSDEFIKQAEHMTRFRILEESNKIQLCWIAAHSKVIGNERANSEAPTATRGTVSTPNQLPGILKRPLPLNSNLIKEQYAMELNRAWR